MHNIYVYKLKEPHINKSDFNIKIHTWQPSLLRIIPPNSSKSYILLWIFHYLKVFKNKKYRAYSIIKDEMAICTAVCVPALFRWPFMGSNDIQIKSVYTHTNFRKQGLAYHLISEVLKTEMNEETTFWYMTNENNFSSINLCQKLGFVMVGKFKHKTKYPFIPIGKLIDN